MMIKHSVLVVDDDLDIRSALIDVLEDHGFEAKGAINGRDALDKLQAAGEEKPCLIVLDLMMPVMDGRAFRETQLGKPALAGIPVLIISAYRDIDQIAHHRRAEAIAEKRSQEATNKDQLSERMLAAGSGAARDQRGAGAHSGETAIRARF